MTTTVTIDSQSEQPAQRGRPFAQGRRLSTLLRRGARPRGAALLSLAASLAAALTVTSVTSVASAQRKASIDEARMAEDMHAYFHGEKWEGPFFFGTGLAAGAVGAVLVTRDDDLARGAAYPVFAVGLLQLIVGSALFLKTDAQVAALDQQLATDPAGFKKSETARMAGVNTRFIGVLLFEAAMIAGGATTAIVAAQDGCCRTLQGVGLGLAGQGAVSLSLELFATVRGRDYATSLSRFDIGYSTAPLSRQLDPVSFGPITFGGRF